MAFFTVITINLNNREGLRRTMESVRMQAFSDYEYLVVDGVSNDGSLEVIDEYHNIVAKKLVEKDKGVYDAMNKGLALATGEYIVFLNSGDEFKSATTLSEIHEGCADKDFVYCDVEVFNEDNHRIRTHPSELSTRFLLTGMICHQAIFAKRTLFEKTGSFSDAHKIYGDYDWLLRAIKKQNATTKHIPKVLVRYEEIGLSNTTDKQKQRTEKDQIHSAYFNPLLVMLYRVYRKFNDFRGK
jgi:glycosyltransferase involved in cell wall biosynthesis